jgi:hypothetical protein
MTIGRQQRQPFTTGRLRRQPSRHRRHPSAGQRGGPSTSTKFSDQSCIRRFLVDPGSATGTDADWCAVVERGRATSPLFLRSHPLKTGYPPINSNGLNLMSTNAACSSALSCDLLQLVLCDARPVTSTDSRTRPPTPPRRFDLIVSSSDLPVLTKKSEQAQTRAIEETVCPVQESRGPHAKNNEKQPLPTPPTRFRTDCLSAVAS